jgi:hypothetical protein
MLLEQSEDGHAARCRSSLVCDAKRLSRGDTRFSLRLALDFADRAFGRFDLTTTQLVAHRLRHVAAHEEQQHGRHDPNHEQRPPAQRRDDGEAQGRRHDEADRERGHHAASHATADAAGAELRCQSEGDRDLAAQAEIRQEAEDGQREHVPGCGDERGEQRKDADRRQERSTAADVIGDRPPE